MKNKKSFKKIIDKLKEKIKEISPSAEIILFGSRARGDYDSESDIDLLILIDKKKKITEEKIINLCYEFELKYDIIIMPLIHSKKEWNSFPYNVSEIKYFIEKEGIKI